MTWPSWMFPHRVDVTLIGDAQAGVRGFKAQPRLAVRLAVACRVLEFPASRSDDLNAGRVFGREAIKHPYLVNFPAAITLTAAHQLAWVRPDDGAVLYLQVKTFERSPDGGRWFPATAYCEVDEAATPPLTTTSGLAPYTPPPGG